MTPGTAGAGPETTYSSCERLMGFGRVGEAGPSETSPAPRIPRLPNRQAVPGVASSLLGLFQNSRRQPPTPAKDREVMPGPHLPHQGVLPFGPARSTRPRRRPRTIPQRRTPPRRFSYARSRGPREHQAAANRAPSQRRLPTAPRQRRLPTANQCLGSRRHFSDFSRTRAANLRPPQKTVR